MPGDVRVFCDMSRGGHEALVYGPDRGTVAIPRFLADELAAVIDGSELLFTSPSGAALPWPNFLRRVWQPAVTECGLGDLVPHDLRHTAASLAISAGASVKADRFCFGADLLRGARGSLVIHVPTTQPRRRAVPRAPRR